MFLGHEIGSPTNNYLVPVVLFVSLYPWALFHLLNFMNLFSTWYLSLLLDLVIYLNIISPGSQENRIETKRGSRTQAETMNMSNLQVHPLWSIVFKDFPGNLILQHGT